MFDVTQYFINVRNKYNQSAIYMEFGTHSQSE